MNTAETVVFWLTMAVALALLVGGVVIRFREED